MPRSKSVAKGKRATKKPVREKITRNVTYRFRGIDRSLSKAVYGLETRLALAQRQLREAQKRVGHSTTIDEAYQRLTPGNRRRLLEQAKLLHNFQKR
jgi:hypothetical protein